jgi:hypothetical protein
MPISNLLASGGNSRLPLQTPGRERHLRRDAPVREVQRILAGARAPVPSEDMLVNKRPRVTPSARQINSLARRSASGPQAD